MTRIILHGGYKGFWEGAGSDERLFNSLINAARISDQKVLAAFLALDSPEDFPHIESMQSFFQKRAPDIELNVVSSLTFGDHLHKHAVIFLQGGPSYAQQQSLADYSAQDLMSGKYLIAGSSSGASVICNWGFTSLDGGRPLRGKGLLNISIIPHADSWPVEEYLPIMQARTQTPVFLLNENCIAEFATKTGTHAS